MENISNDSIEEPKKVIPIALDSNKIGETTLEALTCPICAELIRDITDCLYCGNIFCKNCIDECIKKVNDSCPICRRHPFKSSGSRALKNLVLNIKLKCPNELCKEKIEYAEYINHLKNCKYRKYYCKNEGCTYENIVDNIKDIEEHSKICKNKLIKCIYCEKEMKEIDYENHATCECSQIVECSFCNTKMERWFFKTKHCCDKTDNVNLLKRKVEYYKDKNTNYKQKIKYILPLINYKNNEKKEIEKLKIEIFKFKEKNQKSMNETEKASKNLDGNPQNLNSNSFLGKKRIRK